MVRPATVGSRMCLSPGVPRRTRPAPNPWRGGVRRTQWPPQTPRRRSPRHVTASPSVNRRPPSPMPTTQVAQHHPPSPPLRSVIDFLDSYRRGMSPPGVLATRLAGRLVVLAGRAAWLGTTPCRPRSVEGRGRAFGACCFAGKLRSLPVRPDAAVAEALDPYASGYASPYAGHPRTPLAAWRPDSRWSCPLVRLVVRKNRGRLGGRCSLTSCSCSAR